MKRSGLKSKIRISRLARRFMALLMVLVTVAALAWPGYDTLPTVSAANAEDTVMPLAVPEENGNLLAWFDFEDRDGKGRLDDKSPNGGVKATLKYGDGSNVISTLSVSGNDYVDSIIGTVSGNNYVDNIISTLSVSGNNYVDSTISAYSGNDDLEYDIMATDIGSDELEDYFSNVGNNSYYLDLSKGVYLSLTNEDGSGGVLAGMAEVTVEMRVQTLDAGPNWAFFAAPNGNTPSYGNERYLGILLNNSNGTNNVTAERYNNYGNRPVNPSYAGWEFGDWHEIRVVFAEKNTTLYIDDVFSAEQTSDKPLADCLRDNGVLWFGHAPWSGGEGFNGYIDYIKISGTPYNDITEDIEEKHIITGTDPANTVVNMFDYWVFGGQTDMDYGRFDINADTLVNSGINQGHLFLFDGSASIGGAGDNEAFGIWNKYGGPGFKTSQSKWGIVKNNLKDGYPQLALDADTWAAPTYGTLPNLWQDESKKTESMAYLFDLENIDGKVSYPNVTGLFQIDGEGYYYFRSQEVFAELNKEQGYDSNEPKAKESKPDANKITLYNTPWMEVDTNGSRGQFFPFNDWTDLFYEFNGNLVQRGDQPYQANHQPMNHWFGMTIQTKFMQPTNGKLNPDTPMTFEFSGDDDVWIFIDDVLVADVGGVHQRIRVTIDYATGKIQYLGSLASDGINPSIAEAPEYFGYLGEGTETTLRAMFEAALGEEFDPQQWKGDTFADGTMHTLKFFYLERGNAASNCNIRFNLQEPIVERIRKVDQNGDPLEGAEFVLYKATAPENISDGEWWHTASEFKKDGGPITTTVKSDDSGYASLTTANGDPLDWTQNKYYILEETGTPAGYRKNPPIVLQYHDQSGTLTVVNKYESGAYASFFAEWTGPEDVYFAEYNNGTFSKGNKVNEQPNETTLADGLAIVVPVVSSRVTSAENTRWLPMYGSNTYGWNTVTPGGDTESDLIKALAEAAIMQIADSTTQDWYLRWDGTRLKGYMENLPGDATRYVFNSGSNADGDLVTLFIPGAALKELGLSGTYKDDNERYMALRNALAGKNAKTLAEGLSGLRILYTENYIKNSRTVIYVPNEQRELRVRKVDENGNPLEGAVFALFSDPEQAAAAATTSAGAVAYGKTGKNGELIFRANGLTNSEADYGYAAMKWDSDTAVYWLKELTAPKGYELNKSLIRVEVDSDGIYANATGFDSKGKLLTGDAAANDGIRVEASLGRLNQTMVKYAEGIVDETLKYITVTKQTANSGTGAAVGTWGDNGDAAEWIYDVNGNGYGSVKVTADNGYIRVMPRQTKGITNPTAKRDTLTHNGKEDGTPINLDGLFSLINTVVVTDMSTPTSPAPSGNLEISVLRDNVPQTGDNSHPGLWLAMLVFSLVVMGMSLRTLRRKNPS